MDIRRITERDIPAVKEMYLALYAYFAELGHVYGLNPAYADGFLAAQTDSRLGTVLVLWDGGAIRGFAAVSAPLLGKKMTIAGRKNVGMLTELYVAPEFRGRGFGKALLAKAEGFLRELGVADMQVEVITRNVHARELYEGAGYAPIYAAYHKKL